MLAPMAHPTRCPLCAADYRGGSADTLHVTVGAEPGGTPSPWRPQQPGRVLTMLCLACGRRFPWDYFADAQDAEAKEPMAFPRWDWGGRRR